MANAVIQSDGNTTMSESGGTTKAPFCQREIRPTAKSNDLAKVDLFGALDGEHAPSDRRWDNQDGCRHDNGSGDENRLSLGIILRGNTYRYVTPPFSPHSRRADSGLGHDTCDDHRSGTAAEPVDLGLGQRKPPGGWIDSNGGDKRGRA